MKHANYFARRKEEAPSLSTVTEGELLEAEAAEIEAERQAETDACPYPGPTPIGDKRLGSWHGGWSNTHAVGPESWGHTRLGDRRFATRFQMQVALEEHDRALLKPTPIEETP
jgi:hypothetical protein